MGTRAFELDGLVNVDVKDAVSNLKKVDGEVENTGKTTDGFMSKLKKLGGAIAGAFVVKAVVDFGKKCVGLASDLDEVQNVVDVTFGQGAETINKFAKDAATNFGMSELQAKKFTGTMGAMTKSMGLTSDETLKMSTDLTGLAGDMASFYNLDHEDAFNKIRAGISGETEPLKQLGINMSVANLEAYALAQGISKPYKEMSQSEQTMLRYNYLMNATKDAQGDFNRTSDGFANQMRIVKLNIENVAGSIGKLLLPGINKLLTGFNGIITKVMDFGTKISEGFGVFKTELDSNGEFSWAFGQMLENIFGISLPEKFYWMVQSIQIYFMELWDVLLSIWDTVAVPIIDTIKQVFSGLGSESSNIFNFISDAFALMTDYINTAWATIGQPIIEGIMSILGILRDYFASKMPEIKEFFGQAVNDIKTFWETNLKPTFEAIGNFISNVLVPVFEWVFKYIIVPLIDTVFNTIGKLWTGTLKPIFIGITEFLRGVFTLDFSRIWNGIVNMLKGLWNGIKTILWAPVEWFLNLIKPIADKIIAPFKKAADAIGNVWGAIKGFFKLPHFNISGSLNPIDWVKGGGLPKIGVEWYAKGGIMENPTLFGFNGSNAMVGGERGPEAITPISVLQDYVRQAVAENNSMLVTVLQAILNEIKDGNDTLYNKVVQALIDGVRLDIDNRELGRLVRSYAK